MSESLAPNSLHRAVEQLSGMSFPAVDPYRQGTISYPEIRYGIPYYEALSIASTYTYGGSDYSSFVGGIFDDEGGTTRVTSRALTPEEMRDFRQGHIKSGDQVEARDGLMSGRLVCRTEPALFAIEEASDGYPDGLLVIPSDISANGLRRVIATAYTSHNRYTGSENRNRRMKGEQIDKALVGELLSMVHLPSDTSYIRRERGNRWDEYADGTVEQPEKRPAKLYLSYPDLSSEQIADIQTAQKLGLPLDWRGENPHAHQRCYVIGHDGSNRPPDVGGPDTSCVPEWYAIRPDEVAVSIHHVRGTGRTAWYGPIFAHRPEAMTPEQSSRLQQLDETLAELREGHPAPPPEPKVVEVSPSQSAKVVSAPEIVVRNDEEDRERLGHVLNALEADDLALARRVELFARDAIGKLGRDSVEDLILSAVSIEDDRERLAYLRKTVGGDAVYGLSGKRENMERFLWAVQAFMECNELQQEGCQ